MSHRDTVFEPPPGFSALAVEPALAGRRLREHRARPLRDPVPPRGRPHPVRHRDPRPASCARSPAASEQWSPASVIERAGRARSAPRSGRGPVICGLSGGVDSSVAALLVHRAVGDRLTCVLVDHGLMRKDEAEQVVERVRRRARHPARPRRRRRALPRPARRRRPTRRRSARSSARSSSASSRRRRRSSTDARYLVQGTLYSDVIESGGGAGAATIKSHHNVGGLPDDLDLELVEPLRMLFKDEVRAVGAELGLPRALRLAPAVPRARAWRSGSSAAR